MANSGVIASLRELHDGLDMSDEEREQAEEFLSELETASKEDSERSAPDDPAPLVAEVDVDLEPLAEALSDFGDAVAGQMRDLSDRVDNLAEYLRSNEETEVDEDSEEEVRAADDSEPVADKSPSDEKLEKIEKSLSALTDLVKKSVPVRRGLATNDDDEEGRAADDTSKLEERLKEIEDPYERLHKLLGHMTGEESLVT